MATILIVIALTAAGAVVPEIVKRWVGACSQMERLRMQRSADLHAHHRASQARRSASH